jgi:hypothetical protein
LRFITITACQTTCRLDMPPSRTSRCQATSTIFLAPARLRRVSILCYPPTRVSLFHSIALACSSTIDVYLLNSSQLAHCSVKYSSRSPTYSESNAYDPTTLEGSKASRSLVEFMHGGCLVGRYPRSLALQGLVITQIPRSKKQVL